jgi:Golgi phosphoprotein 3
MSEGLTRRRGGGSGAGSTSPNLPSSSNFSSPSTTPAPGSNSAKRASLTPTPNPSAANTSSGFAGSSGGNGAIEGRGKIAFDPRDYENGSMGGEKDRMPRLTIMEEVLLLGLKDKQVS